MDKEKEKPVSERMVTWDKTKFSAEMIREFSVSDSLKI
jgi:hypothetical protein